MRLANLTQPGFNTTVMGVLRGVFDYYGMKVSDGAAYGGSGHAFLVNIHDRICPSGPYVWKFNWFLPLVRNLGVEMEDLGFFHSQSTAEERAKVEQALRTHLGAGRPCSLLNMEHQLVCGYEDGQLLLARPWESVADVTPATLTCGTWQEFGKEVHVNFFVLHKRKPQPERLLALAALRAAVGLFRDPGRYNCEGYGIGPAAYENWLKALPEHGGSHGNWWNATVWSECRQRAADWFTELAGTLPGPAAARAQELSGLYREVAERLAAAADKKLATDRKADLLTEARDRDLAAIGKVEELAGLLG